MNSSLSPEEIRQRLGNLFTEYELSPARVAYREAAAVLCYFQLDQLEPVGMERDAGAAAEFSADCDLARDEQGNEAWTLRPAIRVETLKTLKEQGRLGQARAANQSSGLVQTALDRALDSGLQLPGDLPSLRAALVVSGWLEGVATVPQVAEVRAEIQRIELLDPFRELVGDHFAGRTAELATLADYVGYFPARSVQAAVRRKIEMILSIHDKPPLFVHGPGGIGKSTLIAKFILDHVDQVPPEERFPFIYLDFDRAGLTAQEPITLLLEAIRQIGLEFPSVSAASTLLQKEWRDRIATQDSSRQRGAAGSSFRVVNRDYYLDSFADFVNSLKLEEQPLVLVLDTFEEVQYRQASYVSEVFRLLDDVQKRVPRTRTVLSGRDLPKPFIGNKAVKLKSLELKAFDDEAAVALLRHRGRVVPKELNAPELETLNGALLDAFPVPAGFAAFVSERLSKNLGSIAPPGLPYAAQVASLSQFARAQGWIGELVTAALAAMPKNPKLREFGHVYGFSSISDDIARRIVGQVGRAPLVLRVAADLWKREGSSEGIEGLSTGFIAKLKGSRVEAQLYTRFLKHIHGNTEVERLVHPGLVLRRITAPIIMEVLAGPCQVEVPTIERARELLKELKAEFTLVIPDPADPQAVIHRPDVRALMLETMRDDLKERVGEIHAAAADYFARQPGPDALAEQVYHRLSLAVDRRWLRSVDLEGLDRRLPLSAIRELPPEAQGFLAARLPIEVEEKVWEKANQDDWVEYAMRRTREGLQVDDVESAVRVVEAEHWKPKRLSWLAELLALKERWAISGSELSRLLEALETEFTPDQLGSLVKQSGYNLKEYRNTLEMALVANVNGWIRDLARAALDELPSNARLYAIAQGLGKTALSNETLFRAQQSVRHKGRRRLDVNLWRERLGEIERQICRIERMKLPVATGFLAGPGTVLLPSFALPEEAKPGDRLHGMALRFDFRRSRGDAFEGDVVDLAKDASLIDRDDTLMYALIRVEDDRLHERGRLGPIAHEVEVGSPLLIFHHPEGEMLKMTFDSEAVIGLGDAGSGRLLYRLETQPGSAGGACLTEDMELVAMHLGSEGDHSFGVMVDAIRRRVAERGLGMLGQPNSTR
jgi:hypothetical protein